MVRLTRFHAIGAQIFSLSFRRLPSCRWPCQTFSQGLFWSDIPSGPPKVGWIGWSSVCPRPVGELPQCLLCRKGGISRSAWRLGSPHCPQPSGPCAGSLPTWTPRDLEPSPSRATCRLFGTCRPVLSVQGSLPATAVHFPWNWKVPGGPAYPFKAPNHPQHPAGPQVGGYSRRTDGAATLGHVGDRLLRVFLDRRADGPEPRVSSSDQGLRRFL